MKRKKNKTLIAILIVIICIVVGIIVAKKIIEGNKPKCPNDYDYDENSNLCIKILKKNAVIKTEYYCLSGKLINNLCYTTNSNYTVPLYRTIEECPDGYTTSKSGTPGIEVPQLDVPGITKKCYKRITQTPYN